MARAHFGLPPKKTFAGREIQYETPFSIDREAYISLKESDRRQLRFEYFEDMPFQITSIQMTVIGYSSSDVIIDPQPTVLGHLLKVELCDARENIFLSHDVPFVIYDNNQLMWAPPTTLLLLHGYSFFLNVLPVSRELVISNIEKLSHLRIKASFIGTLLHLMDVRQARLDTDSMVRTGPYR